MRREMDVFYWGESPHRLFIVLHHPPRPAHTGLVICPPFGEEMLLTYDRLARWAKGLAERGIAVLRFHPCGTGESDGHSADFNLDRAVTDAVAAATCLRKLTGAQRAGFFGLRLGGPIAVRAAANLHPDFLLLWSPILNLRQYCRDLFRMRLTKELVHQQYAHVKVTTQSMIQELEAGRAVDLMGYDVSPELYHQFDANPPWPERAPAPETLWLGRPAEQGHAMPIVEAWKSRGCRAEAGFLPEPAFWEDYTFPQRFADASYQWLARRANQ